MRQLPRYIDRDGNNRRRDDKRGGRNCGGNMHWMKGRDEIGVGAFRWI